jgi:hypothetical protein
MELGPLDLAAQHSKLVAEHGDLDVLGVRAAKASEQHADKPACHEVEKGQGHRPIVPDPTSHCSAHPTEVSEPHGLRGRPVTTTWDPRLIEAMLEVGVKVEEERVLGDLLADLAG